MRRRFGRGRRPRNSSEGREPIDAGHWLGRLSEEGIVPPGPLEPIADDEVPASFAVVARGEAEEGALRVIGFAPRSGGDAALATLAVAKRLADEDGFSGEAIAVAPQWDGAARRRLELVGETPFAFRALAASSLDPEGGAVSAEVVAGPLPLPAERLADGLAGAEARELFQRALAAFEGLAAKHGGTVRGTADGVELVLMARRVALLRTDADRVVLESLEPDRSSADLDLAGLAAALDRLEGQLRKRLNDRRVRNSEEGVRSRAIGAFAQAAGLRATVAWPLTGGDGEVLDLAGLDAEGRPVLGAVRSALGLAELAAILDAALASRAMLPLLFVDAPGPLRLDAPRLALASSAFDPPVLRVLSALTLDHALYEVEETRGGSATVSLRGEGAGAPSPRPARERSGGDEEARAPRESRGRGEGRRDDRRRSRRRSRGRGAAAEREASDEGAADDAAAAGEESAAGGFDDISLFDLDDDGRTGDDRDEEAPRSRRRRRGRGRRRRPGANGNGARELEPAAEEGEAPQGAEEDADDEVDALLDADHDPSTMLAPLAEVEEVEERLPGYDDEEDFPGEPEEDWVQERELRRRARVAKMSPEPAPEIEEAPKRPRKRSAILVHADRDSVAAGVLLARDIRLLEGIWVYPQAELMTFFRSVATDLRPDTPIYVVGFHARPARDTIQAASLYAGRLTWYDHHDWPPEDLEALRAAIGAHNVGIEPGTGSSIPAVLADRTRRSRFSDKLVELFTGRFSQHDYERWGRLWWQRIGDLAQQFGERRHSVDPLLAGRPSDLARDASRVAEPPPPPEIDYVAGRDFRVVHFGGLSLVVLPVPEELDLYLVARVARERFGAQVSLAYREGQELLVLGADEARGRRTLDLGAMVSHLDAKHEWVQALREEDFVARFRTRDLALRPERLDEVVSEIAMGRSILEG